MSGEVQKASVDNLRYSDAVTVLLRYRRLRTARRLILTVAFGVRAAVASAAPSPADCPWAESSDPAVSATMTTVTIEGEPYLVRTKRQREKFEAILETCLASPAIEPLRAWRKHRATLNWILGLAFPSGGLTLLALPSKGASMEEVSEGHWEMKYDPAKPDVATAIRQDKERMITEIQHSAPKLSAAIAAERRKAELAARAEAERKALATMVAADRAGVAKIGLESLTCGDLAGLEPTVQQEAYQQLLKMAMQQTVGVSFHVYTVADEFGFYCRKNRTLPALLLLKAIGVRQAEERENWTPEERCTNYPGATIERAWECGKVAVEKAGKAIETIDFALDGALSKYVEEHPTTFRPVAADMPGGGSSYPLASKPTGVARLEGPSDDGFSLNYVAICADGGREYIRQSKDPDLKGQYCGYSSSPWDCSKSLSDLAQRFCD